MIAESIGVNSLSLSIHIDKAPSATILMKVAEKRDS
jgi:hypothetical protein